MVVEIYFCNYIGSEKQIRFRFGLIMIINILFIMIGFFFEWKIYFYKYQSNIILLTKKLQFIIFNNNY